jgi:hypothetical protein
MVELRRLLSHQHLGVRNLKRPWAKDERACAMQRIARVIRLLASIIDPFTESFDEKNASRARRTLERRLDIMCDADAISLASEQQIDTLLAGAAERV